MTGMQLAEAIKAEWPELSVIIASCFAETPSGINPLPRLPKPFNQSELSKKISEVHPSIGKTRTAATSRPARTYRLARSTQMSARAISSVGLYSMVG